MKNAALALPQGLASTRPTPDADRPDFQVRRPDALQFSTLEGLSRMAGVSRHRLRAVAAKEIVDNALDETDRNGGAGGVTMYRVGDRVVVEDLGAGISGGADRLADLFSASRSMVSGKALRMPRRGLLGNGLRVLAGIVGLVGGEIVVDTRGERTTLWPKRIGPTEVASVETSSWLIGTRIEWTLPGETIPPDPYELVDAESAIKLAQVAGPAFGRRPSPHWLDADHLFETFATIEPAETTVRQVIERLDGCTGATAGKLAAPFGKGRTCRTMSESETADLLRVMREAAREVQPRSLGAIGRGAWGEMFDGYATGEAGFRIGAHEPKAAIPVLIEAWASVTSRKGGDASIELYCNRTPAVGGMSVTRGGGGGGVGLRLSGAGLSRFGAALVNVPGGACELIVAITAPLIPATSAGKAPDLSVLESDIVEAVRRAFVQSRNRLPPDPAEPKPPKVDPPPKPPPPPPFEPEGILALKLAREAEAANMAPAHLMVLSRTHDPFAETKTSRRDAEWFVEQMNRLLAEGKVIHVRGAYYLILASGIARLPDGKRFVGDPKNARLVAEAAKAARWLGLVPWYKIVDERSAPPEYYDTDGDRQEPDAVQKRELFVFGGLTSAVTIPSMAELLPKIASNSVARPRQPYRLCLIGEKVSLGAVLRPIAREVGAELLLATGEVSETMVYAICERAARDGRPLRILYFSDFDPSGWQMPVSVARKIQAHIVREFHDLEVRLTRVALTFNQVRDLNLPDSPIVVTEKRAQAWRRRWGRQQVEIDALAALQPEILDRIARDALAPYWDPTLDDRFKKAEKLSPEVSKWFRALPAYKKAEKALRTSYTPARRAVTALSRAAVSQVKALRETVREAKDRPDPPPVEIEAEIEADHVAGELIFDSGDDFVTATVKLRGIKSLSDDDDEG